MATIDSGCDEILIELDDHGVMNVTMNRPEKKNALKVVMYEGINAALRELDGNDKARVMVISGAGGAFTSGNDVMDFMQHPPTEGGDSPVGQFLQLIATARKPIVAAVDGVAIGVGVTMLLHCDLIYAGESATFKMPFVDLGVCPEAGSSYLIPRLVGHARAAELLMLCEKFSASDAKEMGLINGVVADGEAAAYAQAKAQELAAKAPGSLRITKQLMRQGYATVLEETLRIEGKEFMARVTAPEAIEAFTAFAERRKPDFSPFS